MNPNVKLNYLKKPFKKFSNLKLSKKSKLHDEVTEVTLDRNDSIIEKFADEPNLSGLKGELETAVSQYLNQVKGLGIYRNDNPRDKPCQFTTFKTPALPKKTTRPLSLPDEQLLDVKFRLTEDPTDESSHYENSDIKSRCLDNPLYLTLSDCSTGNIDINKEGYYEKISSDISDEDHIYENVETVYHLYDTVSNPPRPKLPPKVGTLSKQYREIGKGTRKSHSFQSLSSYERYTIPNRNPVRLKELINQTQDDRNVDGSETSDLGSSGSEDTNSVEDWPLPPKGETAENPPLPPPLPPPPRPENALNILEEKLSNADNKASSQIESIEKKKIKKETDSEYYKGIIFRDSSNSTKSLDYQNSDKSSSEINEADSQFYRTESFGKKHLKSKLFTLNKGLHAYNKATKNDSHQSAPKFIVVETDPERSENSVRHSVIIELQDPKTSTPSSLQPTDVQIKEKLENIKSKSNTIHRSDSISVDIKHNNECNTSKSNNSVTEIFNEQIIEISDDGSWEMKDSLKSQSMESTMNNSSDDIDPFTGFAIMASLQIDDSIVKPKEIVKEYEEPEVYFDDKIKLQDKDDLSNNVPVLSNTIAKSKEMIMASFGNTDQKIRTVKYVNKLKASDEAIVDNHLSKKEIAFDQEIDSSDEHSTNQKHNLGAAIMEGYEKDLQRKKDNLNLPEVSLFEFGDAVKDLEQERKSVIEQMTVKVRKKDSWIRSFRSPMEVEREVSTSDEDKDASLIKGVSMKKKLFENRDEKVTKTNRFSFGTNKFQNKDNKTPSLMARVQSSFLADNKPTQEDKVHRKFIDNNADKLEKKPKKDNKLLDRLSFLTKTNNANSKENSEQPRALKKETKNIITAANIKRGEVDSESILTKKAETKSYWETKMLAVDDSGWEPVANVKFRSDGEPVTEGDSPNAVPPPPEFSAENGTNYESLSSEDACDQNSQALINERPARQYVYGSDEEIKKAWKTSPDAPPIPKRMSARENVIEAEIREQQLREEALRRENDIRNRDKTGGASSPSSHASDEGFVERPIEEVPSPPLTSSSPSEGFTHAIKGHDGETIIYDAVSPPSEYFNDKNISSNGNSSEAKIALEIRELKEREAELRALRELREREQQLRTMRGCSQTRNLSDDVDEEVELEIERGTSSSREMLDEHLASFTTTTDEGNYSECGDPASSEDKSSEGSNSRIMSPDLHSYGTHSDHRQRKVTVKPFEDEEIDTPQPVYTQMKKESVIEREIRLAKEREEAFRREKGLLPVTSNTPENRAPQTQTTHSSNTLPTTKNLTKVSKNNTPDVKKVEVEKVVDDEPPKRKVQHRLATNRIQQEIEETSKRERELRNAGQIKTLSEETVDSKVTRLSDFTSDQESSTVARASSVSSSSSLSSLHSSPAKGSLVNGHANFNGHTPMNGHATLSKVSSPPVSPSAVYSPSTFASSAANQRPVSQVRLTRSLSTNNLSLASNSGGGLRMPQKGLMQKFIASRGRMTASAFGPPSSPSFNGITKPLSINSNGISTRPMRISPKSPVIPRDTEPTKTEEPATKFYRRTHATAEEKIHEELRDMKKREEELRRIRARNLARSQPNLAGYEDDVDDETETPTSEGVDSSSFLHEMNGLRSALSNPNLLDDESDQSQPQPQPQANQAERVIRRRSALIAQWEGRIQQTTDS